MFWIGNNRSEVVSYGERKGCVDTEGHIFRYDWGFDYIGSISEDGKVCTDIYFRNSIGYVDQEGYVYSTRFGENNLELKGAVKKNGAIIAYPDCIWVGKTEEKDIRAGAGLLLGMFSPSLIAYIRERHPCHMVEEFAVSNCELTEDERNDIVRKLESQLCEEDRSHLGKIIEQLQQHVLIVRTECPRQGLIYNLLCTAIKNAKRERAADKIKQGVRFDIMGDEIPAGDRRQFFGRILKIYLSESRRRILHPEQESYGKYILFIVETEDGSVNEYTFCNECDNLRMTDNDYVQITEQTIKGRLHRSIVKIS